MIYSRLKYRVRKIDLESISDKYKRNLERTHINIELKKNNANKFTIGEFAKSAHTLIEEKLDPLFGNFESVLNLEENVFL